MPESKKILIVEDSHINQKVLRLFLTDEGYQSSIANNGIEAIQALSNDNYSLILMD